MKKVLPLLVGQSFASGSAFLTGIFVARSLGIESFGIFAILALFAALMQNIQRASIGTPYASITPKLSEADRPEFLSFTLFIQVSFILSIVFLILAVWITPATHRALDPYSKHFPMLIVMVIFYQLHEFGRRYYITNLDLVTAMFMDILRYIPQIAGVLIISMFQLADTLNSVSGYLAVLTLSAAIGTLPALPVLKIRYQHRNRILAQSKEFLTFSRWMFANTLTQWLSGDFYFFLTGALLGPIAVGGLKAAQNLVGIAHIFFQVTESYLLPRLSAMISTNGLPAALHLFKQVTGITLMGTLILTTPMMISPQFMMNSVFGEGYVEQSYVLRFFAIGYSMNCISVCLKIFLNALSKPNLVFAANAISAAISIGSSYILIIKFGLPGAVTGIFISFIINFCILSVLFSRQSN
ncbi:oligosaccharide flippase family protein [Marivivens sp. LCG002]|uniref:lipopolysaccharide biosynthesis protein n=1 Tax=Marivivens sp. LCG002 TaxID=3051171 RepID=UPI0025566A4C|nr:oligosaccharide flippase family protein [Marivivens sp. LCG002]WIV49742.1 oligosaccharide flippase family protein [Marivivens sp. LCG002]